MVRAQHGEYALMRMTQERLGLFATADFQQGTPARRLEDGDIDVIGRKHAPRMLERLP
jgi:hypothetical protein